MKMRTKISFLAAVLLAALAVNAFTHTGPYGALCEKLGGKWGSAQSRCVTRLCYWAGSCGHWTNPARRCELLKTNDPIWEVYFQIGEPDEVKDTRYMWHAGVKGLAVEAVIEQGRLISLTCGYSAV